MMKKNVLITLFAISLLACNSNDNTVDVPQANLAVVGAWDLTEIEINPSQDFNGDGQESTNLLDELDCLTGTLVISNDLVWNLNQTNLTSTTITNGLFNVRCDGVISSEGSWFADQIEVNFIQNPLFSTLQIQGNTLVFNAGEDLPDFQSFTYQLRQ